MSIRIRYVALFCMAVSALLGSVSVFATEGKVDREEFWKRMERIVKEREVFLMKYDKEVKDPKTGVVISKVPREEPNMFTIAILTPAARAATNDIIEYWENSGGGHLKELGMILGTAYRESCQTMLDITEPCVCLNRKRVKEKYKGDVEACRIAETSKQKYSHPVNGKRYWGRGLSQLTGKDRYRDIGLKLGRGQQLVDDPNLALDHSTSVKILVEGMRHAWFTGSKKKLKDYLAEDKDDWIGARSLVNPGSSRAPVTAFFAKKFYSALDI